VESGVLNVDVGDVVVSEVDVAYLGSDVEMQDDPPGPGTAPWDRVVENPGDGVEYPLDREGWFQVGAHIKRVSGNHGFRWEAVGPKVERATGGVDAAYRFGADAWTTLTVGDDGDETYHTYLEYGSGPDGDAVVAARGRGDADGGGGERERSRGEDPR
jgi:hypothetical protein